jgi:hypothetical protein
LQVELAPPALFMTVEDGEQRPKSGSLCGGAKEKSV